jgi:hypothetical protein
MARKLQHAPASPEPAGVQEVSEVPEVQEVKVERPRRARLTEEEILRRMESFGDRMQQFVASVRKGKG